MSLEVAIQENTEVMRELIAALKAGGVVQPPVTQPVAADTKPAEKPAAKASSKSAKAASVKEEEKPNEEKPQWYYFPDDSSYALMTPLEAADASTAGNRVTAIGDEEAKAKHEAEQCGTQTETEKTPAVTYDDVKKMALEVAKVCGREELVRVLNSYSAKNATELKEEQYPQVLVTLETSLKTFQQKAA